MARARYEQLCAVGNRLWLQISEESRRLTEAVRILQDCEDERPEHADRYRREVANLKARRDSNDVKLSRHVARCEAGCKVATGSTFAGENQAGMFSRAPTHGKPDLPPARELSAMLDDGATLEELAEKYGRSVSTLKSRLAYSGFRARHAQAGPTVLQKLLGDEPNRAWTKSALCAQVDPELFFPEKGGSTREAIAVCASCPVQVECLDDALANNERYGIWGGVAERTRRRLTNPSTANPSTTNTHRDAS